jgi:hypothetical protein
MASIWRELARLKQRASERSDRTVDRTRAAIAALRATARKITAESIKQVTRDLEPGFSGLSFQVLRRNTRAYALYREAADAFGQQRDIHKKVRRRRRRARASAHEPRPAHDPLQRLDKRELARRIRALDAELVAERQRRVSLAYDQQTLLARILRLETEVILLRSAQSDAN